MDWWIHHSVGRQLHLSDHQACWTHVSDTIKIAHTFSAANRHDRCLYICLTSSCSTMCSCLLLCLCCRVPMYEPEAALTFYQAFLKHTTPQ